MPLRFRLLTTLLLLGLGFTTVLSSASQYVYLIDASRSMDEHRAALLERVSLDMGHALWDQNGFYQDGDRIHLWSFNLVVQERLKFDFKPTSIKELRAVISSDLARLKWEGGTSLSKPLAKALTDFQAENLGDLSVVLYTDGRGSISKRDAEYLTRLFKQYYEPSSRLANLVLVQFGTRKIAPEAANVLAALGGRIVAPSEPLDLNTRKPSESAQKPPEVKQPEVKQTEVRTPSSVSFAPNTIRFTNAMSSDFVKIIPVEFKVEPPSPGLIVRLSLEATNLGNGLTITASPDRLATEGRQAVTLVISGAQPGHYSTKLNLVAPVPVDPATIPVEFDILPSTPDRIGFQFFSEAAPLLELPANGQWQRVPSAGLSLFYPERLKDALVHFEGLMPPGVDLQALAASDPAKPVELNKPITLAALGRVAGFQLRAVAQDVIGKSLSVKIAVRLNPGQNAQAEGTDTLEIPFRFVTAGEVRIEPGEIALGQLTRGMKSVKRTLNLQVKGEAAGKRLRVIKHGQGLAGISITPGEITLKSGTMSVDLEFSGFEDRPPGAIDGAFMFAAEEHAAVDLRGGLIVVRGTIPGLGTVSADIENPMVVGQPFYIRARLDSGTNSAIHAIVRTPDSPKNFEVTLSDSGSAEAGDVRANDGIFSGMFRHTGALGTYQVWFARDGAREMLQRAPLNVPYFFKPQLDPSPGKLTKRKPGEYFQFKSKIVSDYPGAIAVHVEPAEARSPLSVFASTKDLVAGENTIDLLVGLTPEAAQGSHRFKVFVVTDKIGESRARIPVAFDITVTSLFHYWVQLVAITLAAACLILVAVVVPWKRAASLARSRRRQEEQGTDEIDETQA